MAIDKSTIKQYESPITDAICKKYKLFLYDQIIKILEVKYTKQNDVYWEPLYHKMMINLTAIKVYTPKFFTTRFKVEYALIRDIFGFEPIDARELYINAMDGVLYETKNLFFSSVVKLLKDKINASFVK